MRRGLIFSVLCVVSLPLGSGAQDLDPAQVNGRQIYYEGTSARGGTINAVVGSEATVLPAAALPCVNCHGYDGLGRPEGGVVPANVRWSHLTKNYGHVHEDGRRHGAFDEDSLVRLIVAGVDPSGNQLDKSMPAYQMSDDDMSDLLAYLRVLESVLDPGVEADLVRVATLQPLEGRSADLGKAMEQVLRGVFADVNANGGIYGRRLELVTVALGESPDQSLARLREVLASQRIFALVGGYTVGLDDQLLDILRRDNIPLVGPFTLDPGDSLTDASAFYLYPGLEEQSRAMADAALERAGEPDRVLVASPAEGRSGDLAGAVLDQVRRRDQAPPRVESYSAGGLDAEALAASIDRENVASVVFLGGQVELSALLTAMDARGVAPDVYLLSSLLSGPPFDAPPAFDRRIHVAHPTTAADITPQGQADYRDLAARHGLPTTHIQAQAAAFAAARVFIEGLRLSGRNLARTRLAESIEGLYLYPTGFTRPLTYGPNLRIGAKGAHLLDVDLQNRRYVNPPGDSWRSVR